MTTWLPEVQGLLLAWTRIFPTLMLVPAFGLRALPIPARGILGLTLAACLAPAISPLRPTERGVIFVGAALEQVLIGLPVALSAAIPLWAATMAGGLGDAIRGNQDGIDFAVVEGSRAPLFGILLSMLASLLFLSTGGPARVVEALSTQDVLAPSLLASTRAIAAGIGIAVALGSPLLAASILVDVASALVARAASPSHVTTLLAPLRAVGLLAIFALLLDRIVAALAIAVR
jgi:flagellar biosynthetic protein FliR